MKNENNSPLISRLGSFLLMLALSLVVFLGYFHEIHAINQDLGRHLLTGEIIWETKSVPTTNLYSYTYPNFPFINHHYLSEVIFYLIHQSFGFSGLLFFTSSLIVLSFGLLLAFVFRKTSLIPLSVASLLYLLVLFERTDLRPEIFSYFYLSLFVVILFSFRERITRWIYLLPLLSLLWVNSHIYFPIGLLLIFLFFVDSLITHRKNLKNNHSLSLLGIGIFSGLTTLLNPHGLTGAIYPLTVFQNYGYTIEENQTLFFLESLGFTKPSFLPFKISVFLLFASLFLSIKKTRPIDWLLTITFTILAFSAVRNFPLFVFATFIPFTRVFSFLFEKLKETLSGSPPLISFLPHIFSFIATGLLILQLSSVISQKQLAPHLPQGASKALTFFEENNIKGPLFNNFDIGSYISYRLYPKERVFIDGRPEAYPAEFIQQTYIPMQENSDLFEKKAQDYQFNAIVFSHTDQTPWAKKFLTDIIHNETWVPVYLDPMILILVKDNQQNTELIKQYGMKKTDLQIKNTEDTVRSLYQGALFFQTVGLPSQEQEMYRKILRIEPTNCPILGQLALSEEQQNPITLQRYNLYCR